MYVHLTFPQFPGSHCPPQPTCVQSKTEAPQGDISSCPTHVCVTGAWMPLHRTKRLMGCDDTDPLEVHSSVLQNTTRTGGYTVPPRIPMPAMPVCGRSSLASTEQSISQATHQRLLSVRRPKMCCSQSGHRLIGSSHGHCATPSVSYQRRIRHSMHANPACHHESPSPQPSFTLSTH